MTYSNGRSSCKGTIYGLVYHTTDTHGGDSGYALYEHFCDGRRIVHAVHTGSLSDEFNVGVPITGAVLGWICTMLCDVGECGICGAITR